MSIYSGPKGINWTQAFQFYCETIGGKLPSYQDVADKFDVSKTEVGKRALAEDWTKLRQELYGNGKSLFLENKADLIAKTNEKHLKEWRDIQEVIKRCFEEIEKDLSIKQSARLFTLVKILKIAIEGERTVLGLPNAIPASSYQPQRDMPPKLPPELIQEIDSLLEKNDPNRIFDN